MANKGSFQRKEEEGVAPWLATYGDMITLVLTLFVLLYSFSSIDSEKWNYLVSSLAGTPYIELQALDPSIVGPTSKAEQAKELAEMAEELDVDLEALMALLEEQQTEQEQEQQELSQVESIDSDVEANVDEAKEMFDELYQKLTEHIEANDLDTKLNVEMLDNFIVLHITDSTLFNSGKAYIKPESKELLESVSDLFTEYDSIIKMIRIEGHTDDRQINTEEFASNWELSIARAVNVLKYFLSVTEIDNSKFSAVGYSEYHPIATNETEEGRAQNRRVDFVIESIYVDD